MPDPLLSLEGISKGFPGVRALNEVHLDLRAGEVHAVVGENGAGKSTLMKLLAGIHQKDAGVIRVDGREVEIESPRAAQELGISIIHQEFSLMPDLTIAENIYIGREPRRMGLFTDDRGLNREAADLFARLGIDLDPRAKVGDLLVAQQQVVEIAKALSIDARVLIMDEPTAALTESETANLFRLIRDLRDEGTGVIYISHRLNELKEISDRITVLRDGEYVDTFPTSGSDLRHVIALMVGRDIPPDTRPARGTAENRPVVLEVRGLGSKGLLDDVSFDLREGEILGFAGLVGAGRTEVARIICGADRADRGTILLRGRPVKIATPADAARLRIGYLSEDRKRFGLLLDQDVGFNILASSLSDHANPLGLMRDGEGRRTAERYIESLRIRTPSARTPVRCSRAGTNRRSSSPAGSRRTATSLSSRNRPAASTSARRRRSTNSSISSRPKGSRSS